jgi:hypothetical protein
MLMKLTLGITEVEAEDNYQFVDFVVSEIESLEFLELRQRFRQTSNQILSEFQ